MSRLDHEKDPVVLHSAIDLLQRHNRALTERIAELVAELAQAKGDSTFQQTRLAAMERQLAKLTKQVFGPTSEKRAGDAPEEGAADTGDAPKDEPKKKRGHGPTKQTELPEIEVEHALCDADRVCPHCGDPLCEMAGEFEESEEISVVPLRFVRLRHKRKKYSCRRGCGIETALGPDKLTPGGRYSLDFAIHVAIAKYCDHLPLERQVRMMARDGLVVTSQTLWDQIELLTRLVESVLPRLHEHVLSHRVIGADETTWELMNRKPGQSKSWYVWLLRCETAVYYAIKGGRSFACAEELLASFSGVLMCDGYAAYLSLSKAYDGVVLAHCWAHVRREFVEIEGAFPVQTGVVIDLIGELYAIERDCPRGPEGDEERRRLRDEKSRPVVAKIEAWSRAMKPKCLPESGLAKAIGYMDNMWSGLVRFLDEPAIPLDNNASERAARGPVVGRKNHYGSHSKRGTEVAATLYSLSESAKLCDLEPRLYLSVAARAGLRRERVPLPHEVKAALAAGTLARSDYENDADGIVAAALAAAFATATANADSATT